MNKCKSPVLIVRLSAVLLLFSACAPEIPCSEFRTGSFKLGRDSGVRIIRNDSIQKEFSVDGQSEFTDTYAIRWLDSCTYSATFRATTRPEGHSLSIGDSMLIRVTKTAENGYEWEGHVKGEIKKGVIFRE